MIDGDLTTIIERKRSLSFGVFIIIHQKGCAAKTRASNGITVFFELYRTKSWTESGEFR